MSIWLSIDRTAFEKDLATLCKDNGKFQDTNDLQALEHHTSDDLPLPLEAEMDLSDGFAFLAATTNQPRDVTACAIQQRQDAHAVNVIVAANEGVKADTAKSLRAIVYILKQRALQEINARQAETGCRDVVLDMHRDRIFGRLGFSKAQNQRPSDVDIAGRVRDLLKVTRPTPAKDRLRRSLQDLVEAMRTAENCEAHSKAEKDGLRKILQLTFDLMYVTARPSGFMRNMKHTKEYRALRALAYYWRICQLFAKRTGEHRDCFRSMQMEILDAEKAERSGGLWRYVHAEVQIVLHLEKIPHSITRYVGSSKRPCFLCYCFVRSHGVYAMQASHGVVYDKWTVPAAVGLDSAATSRIERGLRGAVQDTRLAVIAGRPARKVYMHPLQTVSKLLLDRASSVPSSTSTSRHAEPVSQITNELARMSIASDKALLDTCSARGPIAPAQPLSSYARLDQVEVFFDATNADRATSPVIHLQHTERKGRYDDGECDIARVRLDMMEVGDEEVVALSEGDPGIILLEHNTHLYKLIVYLRRGEKAQ